MTLAEKLGISPNLPRVEMQLVGADGNAFSLLGTFRKEARKQGWDLASIEKVSTHAISGDYNNLIATLFEFADDVGIEDNDEDYEYDNDYPNYF